MFPVLICLSCPKYGLEWACLGSWLYLMICCCCCCCLGRQFHQYQVVGRALPSESDEHPKIYRMKLWATNEVRAKSKFWYVGYGNDLCICCYCVWLINWVQVLSWSFGLIWNRYFLRKLKKVKKSNGQVLAINEVTLSCWYHCFFFFFCEYFCRVLSGASLSSIVGLAKH